MKSINKLTTNSLFFLFLFQASAVFYPIFAQDNFQLIGNTSPLVNVVSAVCPDVDTCFTLTQDNSFQSGAVWDLTKIDLTRSFDASFCLTLGNKDFNGADGFAFVMRGINSKTIGINGGGIGYQGITPSIAIEYDTWNNPSVFNDIPEDHTGIYINSNYANPLVPAVPLSPTGANVEDGQYHYTRIVWNAEKKELSVYFDGVLRASSVVDLVNTVFGGDKFVYWGFTSSTGGFTNLQQICFPYTNIRLEDKSICANDSLALHFYRPKITRYTWLKLPGDTIVNWNTIDYTVPFNLDDTLIYVKEPGDYVLDIGFNNKAYKDTASLTVVPMPTLPFAVDSLSYCPEINDLTLDAKNQGAKYTWQPDFGNNQVIVDNGKDGWFKVVIEEPILGCKSSDSLFVITYCDPLLQMPNVFTPNGDNSNDVFSPVYKVDYKWIKIKEMNIFNRWGQRMYVYSEKTPHWDGKFEGTRASDGVYYYTISYTNIYGEHEKNEHGFFHLIGN